MRRLLGAKPIGVLVFGAALVLGVAACGRGNEDGAADVVAGRPAGFKATPGYLAAAVEDLEVVPHRFDMAMRIGVETDDFSSMDRTRLTGVFDGERHYVGLVTSGVVGDNGRSMEQIVDLSDNTLYVRASNASELADAMPNLGAMTEYLEALGKLGYRWGRADLTALADVLPEDWRGQPNQIRVQNLDPSAFLDLVAGAESVEELGTADVQGEPMTGLAATVTGAEFLVQAQGTSTRVTEPSAEAESDSLDDLFASLEYKVEAWIDHDGHVRRLVLDQSEAMEQIWQNASAPQSDTLPGFTSILTLDLSHYGDESMEIEVPSAVYTVDITAAVRGVYEAHGNPLLLPT